MLNRMDKVNELLKQELAFLIESEISEPNIFVTVTACQAAADLKTASIFVSVIGEEGAEKRILKELEKKRNYFQKEIGKKFFIKNIPRLSFKIDKTQERIAKIEEVLEREKERKEK